MTKLKPIQWKALLMLVSFSVSFTLFCHCAAMAASAAPHCTHCHKKSSKQGDESGCQGMQAIKFNLLEKQTVDHIQAAREKNSGIVINAGAYTHTSVALLDALNAAELPAIEVHISNIYRRESFRHHSYISAAAVGVIAGLGVQGYLLALQALARLQGR